MDTNFIEIFRDKILSTGINYTGDFIVDGKIHRGKTQDDKCGKKPFWYVVYNCSGFMVGVAGCWKRGVNIKCTSKKRLSKEEKLTYIRKIKEATKDFDKECKIRQNIAKEKAQQIVKNAQPARIHQYLSLKGINQSACLVSDDGRLVIPLQDLDATVHSIQYIDKHGNKKFMYSGAVQGNFHLIGEWTETVYLVEGYVTGITIALSTRCAVLCCMNSGNLLPVTKAVHERYPNKKIIIIGDNDKWTTGNPGLSKATEAAALIGAELVIPNFDSLDKGTVESQKPTDMNDLYQMCGLDEVTRQLNKNIQSVKKKTQLPANFKNTTKGVFYDDDGIPIFVSSPLEIMALSRDSLSENWGRLLQFTDADGALHTWSMPMELLKGSGEDLRGELLSRGLELGHGSKARSRLLEYITCSKPDERVRCVTRVGWYNTVFVRPDITIGECAEKIIYQSDHYATHFSQKGSLQEWQKNLASYCVGNSRLVLAISTAFASMLLHPAGAESGGIHFVGMSSSGKTTALKVSASVYGAPDYLHRWRATTNGLEALAAVRCDSLLILDELAQVNPFEAGEIAYMLANGSGKARATRTGGARTRYDWRILFLSAGEVGLAQHMNEAGKKVKAGQQVRLVDIPADAEKGLGIFESLHDIESAAAFSKMLTEAASLYYGTPSLKFLEEITRTETSKKIPDMIKKIRDEFFYESLPVDPSGQVIRVCERFALIAAAGEIATSFGITAWPEGEAIQAAKVCFDSWIGSRDGTGDQEKTEILSHVKQFFESHGDSRFIEFSTAAGTADRLKTINRAGFKKQSAMNGTGGVLWYYVLTEVYKNEICKGYTMGAVTKVLREASWIEIDHEGKSSLRENLPGMGRTRCYVFNGKMWEE